MTVFPAVYWKNLIYQMFVLVKGYAWLNRKSSILIISPLKSILNGAALSSLVSLKVGKRFMEEGKRNACYKNRASPIFHVIWSSTGSPISDYRAFVGVCVKSWNIRKKQRNNREIILTWQCPLVQHSARRVPKTIRNIKKKYGSNKLCRVWCKTGARRAIKGLFTRPRVTF